MSACCDGGIDTAAADMCRCGLVGGQVKTLLLEGGGGLADGRCECKDVQRVQAGLQKYNNDRREWEVVSVVACRSSRRKESARARK